MALTWCELSEARDIVATDRPGGRVIRVPAGVRTREAVMDLLAADPDVPDYFGRNWDAVADVLGDLGDVRIVIEAPHLLDPTVWERLLAISEASGSAVGPSGRADAHPRHRVTVIAALPPDDIGDTSPVGDG